MISESRCSGCGTVIADPGAHVFCSGCGRALSEEVPADPQGHSVVGDVDTKADRAAQASANWALGLGLATLVITALGPFALWMGLRSRRHGGGRAIVGIVLGSLGTLVLAAGLMVFVATVVMFGALGTAEDGTSGVGGLAGIIDRAVAAVEARDPTMGSLLRSIRAAWNRPEIVERIPLSSDQQAVIENYGHPNRFILGAGSEGERAEIWDYLICTGDDPFLKQHFPPQRLYFANGDLLAWGMIQPVATQVFRDYRPTEFDLASDEAQIRALMGKPTEVRELDMQEYGAATVLNYRNEIMFMFLDGKPLGVMTFVTDATIGEARP